MVRQTGKARKKRFTVTVDRLTYERLLRIANSQKPPLSLSYVVDYGLQKYLASVEEAQLELDLSEHLRGSDRLG